MLPEELRYSTIAKNFPFLSQKEKMDIIVSLFTNAPNEITSQEKVKIINHILDSSPTGSSFIYPVDNGKNVNMVLVEDIYYIKNPKGNLMEMETVNGLIKFETCRINLLEAIEESNAEMKKMDHKLLVNKSNIRAYHSGLNRVYFTEDISVQVTGGAIKHVSTKVLNKTHDLNNTKFEYAPIRKMRLDNNLRH